MKRRQLGPPIAVRHVVPRDKPIIFVYTLVIAGGPRRGRLAWYCIEQRSTEPKVGGLFEIYGGAPVVIDNDIRKIVKNKKLLAQLFDEVREAIAARVMLMEET